MIDVTIFEKIWLKAFVRLCLLFEIYLFNKKFLDSSIKYKKRFIQYFVKSNRFWKIHNPSKFSLHIVTHIQITFVGFESENIIKQRTIFATRKRATCGNKRTLWTVHWNVIKTCLAAHEYISFDGLRKYLFCYLHSTSRSHRM